MCTIPQMGKTSDLKVRLEPELLELFREAAHAEDKKVSAVIRELMGTYVEHYQKTIQQDLFFREDNENKSNS